MAEPLRLQTKRDRKVATYCIRQPASAVSEHREQCVAT